MSLINFFLTLKDFKGHKGRPGKRGGSMSRSGGERKFPKEGIVSKINGVPLSKEAQTSYSSEKSKLKTSVDRTNFDQYIYQRAKGRIEIGADLIKEAANKTKQMSDLRRQEAAKKFRKIAKM